LYYAAISEEVPMESSFDPERIRIPKVAEVVANTLRRRIITGQYEVGELLPSEGALMASFDVARTTIRDAFRVLESEGLLEVRRGGGGGGRVRAPSTSMVADYAGLLLQFEGTTVADVHVARTLIEAPAAATLARAGDPTTVAELRAILAEEGAAADDEALVWAEVRFHQAIVELTGNRALTLLCSVVNGLIAKQIVRSASGGRARRAPAEHRSYAKAHRAHAQLVDLIERGDATGAERLWRRHLEAARTELTDAPTAARTVVDLLP
jgi:GntR family transcriptional regulator, transcriptional repressor for pyruvate dehydrogenase complex